MALSISTAVNGRKSVLFFCAPCDTHHSFTVARGAGDPTSMPVWRFNGDLEKPTFGPSLRVSYGGKKVCHLFLRAGMVEYLPDCFHDHAGKAVPVQPPC